MKPDNQTDRVEEVKKKLKQDAEIRQLRHEAEIEQLKAKFKHELKKKQAMEQAFEEAYQELFPGKDQNDLTEDEQKKFEDLQDTYIDILDSEEDISTIDDKTKQEETRQRIIDEINKDEEIRKAFQEALENLKQEYGDLSQLSTEKFTEYTRRRENLEDKMYDMLDSEDTPPNST